MWMSLATSHAGDGEIVSKEVGEEERGTGVCVERRSDDATAVDVEVPQSRRLSRSQTNFALEAGESLREMNRSVVPGYVYYLGPIRCVCCFVLLGAPHPVDAVGLWGTEGFPRGHCTQTVSAYPVAGYAGPSFFLTLDLTDTLVECTSNKVKGFKDQRSCKAMNSLNRKVQRAMSLSSKKEDRVS